MLHVKFLFEIIKTVGNRLVTIGFDRLKNQFDKFNVILKLYAFRNCSNSDKMDEKVFFAEYNMRLHLQVR